MTFKSKLVFLFSFLLSFELYSQQKIVDSLITAISNSTDEKKVEIYAALCDLYSYIDTKKAVTWGEKGIELAKTLNFEAGLADNYGSLGYSYINTDNAKATELTEKALEIRKKLKNDIGMAKSYNVLGIINYYSGNYLVSLDYHFKALKIREEKGIPLALANSYNNLALVSSAIGNYEEALDYLNKALQININFNQPRAVSISYDNIGDIYSKTGRYQKALEYFTKALAINRESGNKKLEAYSTYNFAVAYKKINDTASALKYYRLASEIYENLDEKNGIANVENGFADIYKKSKNFELALIHAHKALTVAQSINTLENISLAANTLQLCYSMKGDYKKAFEYLSIYQSTFDSLKNSEKVKKIAKVEFEYKMEKIKDEQKIQLNQVRYFIIILSITLFLLLIIGALIVWGYIIKRRSNETLNLLNLKLQEMNSTKDKFFSIIAHDMKSPFQGLLGYSQVLTEDYDELEESEKKEFIQSINSLTKNTFKLLENLLNWSRLQTGKLEFSPGSIDLLLSLQQTLDLTDHNAKSKLIFLVNRIQPGIMVFADSNMLDTIVRNLISNSIKFTNAGGSVTVNAALIDDYCEVSVSDTGIGMNANTVANLFKIEINNSTPGTDGERGTGLGLLICKDMVELHGGNIWVESEIGKGSKFSFKLKRSLN